MILFDKGDISGTSDWQQVHTSYVRAIQRIDHPEGSGALTLRRKARIGGSDQLQRNGVGYLKTRFLRSMVEDEGWQPEGGFNVGGLPKPVLRLYPDLTPHDEPLSSGFGGFDFVTQTQSGAHVAIEWETGNISSSHRSVNKLVIALRAGRIQAGVLILPSRDLYEHLTDRIGNISELGPYLSMWCDQAPTVSEGLLAITVVEHDELTDDHEHPYLKSGLDGRAKQGRTKIPGSRT